MRGAPGCEARFDLRGSTWSPGQWRYPAAGTELRLKIVSEVCCTDHKRGKTFDWNEHKKALLKAGKRTLTLTLT